jgi:hypothetical protein
MGSWPNRMATGLERLKMAIRLNCCGLWAMRTTRIAEILNSGSVTQRSAALSETGTTFPAIPIRECRSLPANHPKMG